MDNRDFIITRMQRLACLGLEGEPAAELQTATAAVWIERLSRFNPERLRMAFDIVEATATRWPTPATIIKALPEYEHTYAPPLPPERRIAPDPERIAASKSRIDSIIAECAAKLHVEVVDIGIEPGTHYATRVSVPALDALLGKEGEK